MLGFLRFAREGLTSIDLIDLIDNTKEQSEDEMWMLEMQGYLNHPKSAISLEMHRL